MTSLKLIAINWDYGQRSVIWSLW